MKKKASKKEIIKLPNGVIVTKISRPEGETSFPEKLKKANDMLSRTKFIDDQN